MSRHYATILIASSEARGLSMREIDSEEPERQLMGTY